MVFAKPENALKRAEEFIDVGKKQRALDTLYEVIRSKKHRSWQKIHEPIMKNYLNLCVELKESHMAKDGLHQYKTICQNVNVKSLEDVINGFLQLAEEKAERAKKDASDANILVDVDDLEALNSPESLLLKAVSGESSQDRADRDFLAPWLKFVWESYKQCLELLKNNNKVEVLYQQVAKQAFAFCVKYQRKTEFRKLCETIRQHMVQSQKYANQPTSIDLNKPETQNNHLETRLYQLNHAISMELWQEAYKAVEDIYGLMSLSRTKPKPGQMFNYYSKLSLIFWKAGNHLFHAATLQKLFVLLKEQKKTITNEELTKISTRLLLATLAIPIPPNRSLIDECLDQDEITQEKIKRLSSLLNLQQPPTRVSLIKDLTKYNVIQHVFPETRDLYKWLEVEFHPLKLSERVAKCLDFIETSQESLNENYVQYVQAIKEIAVTRLLKQISQIYTTIEIKRFVHLAPRGIDVFSLEKLIVDAAKQLDLQVRINHQSKSLHFGNDLYVTQKEDSPEGPTIQSMLSEQIRNQLITMSDGLQQAHELIYSNENKLRRDELSQTIAHVCRQTSDKHHMDLLRRKQLIEEQKEMYERLVSEREQAEAEEKKQKQEERERLSLNHKHFVEGLKMIDSRRQNENDDERDRQAEQEDIELKKQIEQANREKKELMERLKKEEKKFDHFVRACHEVEIPILSKLADEDSQTRMKFWEEVEVERIDNLKKERQLQAENRDRLLRMKEDKENFEKIIHDARKEDYEEKMAEFQVKLKAARESKLAERKDKRKLDRRNEYFADIEKKKKREEDERRAREDEEKKRKLDEQAEIQRKREREMEERLAQQGAERERKEKEQQQQQTKTEYYKPRGPAAASMQAASRNLDDNESSWRRGNFEEDSRDSRAAPARRDFKDSRAAAEPTKEREWRKPEPTTERSDLFQRKPPTEEDQRPSNRGMGGSGGGGGFGGRGDRSDRGGTGGASGSSYNRPSDRPERSFMQRSGGESKADTADSWRRGGGPADEPAQDNQRRGGRSYRDERNQPDHPETKDEGWTEVKGKK